jgi:hypothetical protein
MRIIKLKNTSFRNGRLSIGKTKSSQSKEKDNFVLILKSFAEKAKLILTPEYRFTMQRQFRADWCVSNGTKTCLLEYEGINGEIKKIGGVFYQRMSGHTSVDGYTENCEKYNLAQMLGYPVFRYTKMNYTQVEQDLKNFFTDNYGK